MFVYFTANNLFQLLQSSLLQKKFHPMLVYCWAIVCDVIATIIRHLVSVNITNGSHRHRCSIDRQTEPVPEAEIQLRDDSVWYIPHHPPVFCEQKTAYVSPPAA